ncbi:MAG: HD-GYP domain-containing protein [Candidatus Aquicultorales bacterium]
MGLFILAFVLDPATIDSGPGIRQVFVVLIGVAVVYNFVIGLMIKRNRLFPWFGYLLLVCDSTMIAIAIYFTGGIYSHVYLLLPLLILSATARDGKRGAIIASGWITVVLVGLWAFSRDPLSQRAFEFLGTRALYLMVVGFFAQTLGAIKEEMIHLKTLAEKAELTIENAGLYDKLKEAYFQTVMSLTEAVEAKDTHTRGHSEEVAVISRAIAEKVGLPQKECEDIFYAALLHDVGKIGTPESILTKEGPLTLNEYEEVKRHTKKGYEIVKPVAGRNGIATYALLHHEHYNGEGYPNGSAGEEIPLGARIIAVADAFQAMVSDRPYREALDIRKAVDEVRQCSGSQFDPTVVAAFLEVIEERFFLTDQADGSEVDRLSEAGGR